MTVASKSLIKKSGETSKRAYVKQVAPRADCGRIVIRSCQPPVDNCRAYTTRIAHCLSLLNNGYLCFVFGNASVCFCAIFERRHPLVAHPRITDCGKIITTLRPKSDPAEMPRAISDALSRSFQVTQAPLMT
jgi:hypothetical protein